MKALITYTLLFILAVALFEMGERTSIHFLSQMGLVAILTCLYVAVKDVIAAVREINQFR
jgi:ABC-type proline/glycine betaine transport system permease subunit